MLYGLYVSASGMMAQEQRQDIITNNLANANTTGFKRDLANIRARQNPAYEDPAMSQFRTSMLSQQGGGVVVEGGGVDLSQSILQYTGVPTDLALEGKGFFVVQGQNAGQTALTRDGSFLISQDGTLVASASNRPVLSTDGTPIKVDPTKPVSIDPSGNVSQDGSVVSQLKLADVTDPRNIVKLGQNLMTVNDPKALTAISPDTVIRSGNLEESGVDPVIEMVNMMEGQRAFDANAKMIGYQDQTLQQVNGVGKIA